MIPSRQCKLNRFFFSFFCHLWFFNCAFQSGLGGVQRGLLRPPLSDATFQHLKKENKKKHPCCEDCVWMNAGICCCPSGLTDGDETQGTSDGPEQKQRRIRPYVPEGSTCWRCHARLTTLLEEQNWNHSSTRSWKSPDVG